MTGVQTCSSDLEDRTGGRGFTSGVSPMKTKQKGNNYETKVLSLGKKGPGSIVSLVVSLQRKQTCMQGKQITTGHGF